RLRVTDVEIAVWLGWESSRDTSAMLPGRQVLRNNRTNEIDRHRRGRRVLISHGCPYLIAAGRSVFSDSASVGNEQSGGALDLGFAGEVVLLEGRGVWDGRIECADDADRRIQALERLFLNDGRQALADAACS